jgi:hypothetical protein
LNSTRERGVFLNLGLRCNVSVVSRPSTIFAIKPAGAAGNRRAIFDEAIASEWGPSEYNRRARFYRLTRVGAKLLEAEKRDWEQTAAIIARFFEVKAEDLA